MSTNLKIEELATNAQTWEHIDTVMRLLASAQIELMRRQFTHDRSKLACPEVSTFTEFTPKLKGSTYGSDEYKKFLADMKPALDHHYEHNRHHPEFFGQTQGADLEHLSNQKSMVEHLDRVSRNESCPMPDDSYGVDMLIRGLDRRLAEAEAPINGMNLFDLLEMFVDWCAACQRHADGDINRSIEINKDRFLMSPQLVRIFKNTVPWVYDEFAGLGTQKDLAPVTDRD